MLVPVRASLRDRFFHDAIVRPPRPFAVSLGREARNRPVHVLAGQQLNSRAVAELAQSSVEWGPPSTFAYLSRPREADPATDVLVIVRGGSLERIVLP